MSKSTNNLFEITPQVLLKAYACGIFPMAESSDDPALYWIEPEERGVLPLDQVHVARRLAKTIRSEPFEIKIDTDFEGIISGCAEAAPGRRKTWINRRIRDLYSALFEQGHCHTVEAWQDGQLVGGLYGIHLGGAFFGESMFHRSRDASKISLIYLVARLRAGGFQLLDSQFITNHLRRFGAIELDRSEYHAALEAALVCDGDYYSLVESASPETVLQLVSQTSNTGCSTA